jgi:hypothetical protein
LPHKQKIKKYRYTPVNSSGMKKRLRRVEQEKIKAPQEHRIPSKRDPKHNMTPDQNDT